MLNKTEILARISELSGMDCERLSVELLDIGSLTFLLDVVGSAWHEGYDAGLEEGQTNVSEVDLNEQYDIGYDDGFADGLAKNARSFEEKYPQARELE